jgi:hypothetical protein
MRDGSAERLIVKLIGDRDTLFAHYTLIATQHDSLLGLQLAAFALNSSRVIFT